MEKVLLILYTIGLVTIGLIIGLLLLELGLLRYLDDLYLKVVTHPKFDDRLHTIGDVLLALGIGLTATGLDKYVTSDKLTILLVSGIILILFGSYLKEKFRT